MIEIEIYNTFAAILAYGPEKDSLCATLDAFMKVEVPGARYTWDYKRGYWDGTTRLWQDESEADPGVGPEVCLTFPTGLVPAVDKHLRAHAFPNIQYRDHRKVVSPQLNQTQVSLRPYQHEAITAALGNTMNPMGWWPRGILQVATGGGKTEIAVSLYEMHKVPTMFLVHRKDLLLQAKERFEGYGHNPGLIGAGHFDVNDGGVTIATLQTIHGILKDEDDERHKYLKSCIFETRQIFVDECHLVASTLDKGNMFTETVDQFTNAYARWGLTATPFMRTKYDNLLLEGAAGSVLYRISNDNLIKLGYLTPPNVRMLPVPGKIKVPNRDWKKVKHVGIIVHDERNKILAQEIVSGEGPILALVDTTEQGIFLQNKLKKDHGVDIEMLSGKTSAKARRAAVADLRSGKTRAIIATTIFDEGVDIPELRKVVLCSGGKSQVKLLQRLGRGVRLADGKTVVEIVDCADTHHGLLRKHALARLKLYKQEGFKVAA